MASHNYNKESIEKSRVSSNTSSQNQSYELIPREQPYYNPNRDLPSPRASFPFKRVQGGFEAFQGQKSHNNFKGSVEKQKKQQKEQNQLIQVKKQLNGNSQMRNQLQKATFEVSLSNPHEKCHIQIQKLNGQINVLQQKLLRQSEDFQLERKANEIFNQSFMKIREFLAKKKIELQGESMEQIVQKLEDIINKNRYEGNFNQLLDEQDSKIRQLRAELLKSSQNNINAIFNTEITQAQCLNLQIKKMNGDIMALKQNIFKINSQNKKDGNLFYQGPLNAMKEQKTINIYHHNRSYDSSDDEELFQKQRKYKQSHSKKKGSRQSESESDSHKKSRRLSSTENKVGELIDGYKLLREEYRSLQQTIKQLNNNQSDYKIFFNTLKTQINTSISNQIKQVKQTIRRPSSNSQQRKMAKDLQNKLNHLINTLNAPQRANQQKSGEQEQKEYMRIQAHHKLLQLQALNYRVEQENKQLMADNLQLQQTIHKMKVISRQKSRQNELHIQTLQSARKKGGRKLQLDELLNASRSDLKEQQLVQQISGIQNNPHVVHTSNINKLHSSQSYHQSNHKNSQIEQLHRKLQIFQQQIREKQLRITELQNTIIDHFQSRAVVMRPLSNSQLKQKYEIYINNLKILLSEAKKQNEVLRKEFIKVNELNLSRANQDQDRKSNTFSERTTKNVLAQTRLMRRQVKISNNYDSIQLKLKIEDQMQKIFLNLLQLYQQSFQLIEQDRKSIGNSIITLIISIIKDACLNRSRIFQQTMQREEIRNILAGWGVYQK